MVEAYCTSKVPGVPEKTTDEDYEGYAIFKKHFSDVVLFTGSHRFLDEELPELLGIMAKRGGDRVPDELRKKILDRVQAGPHDPRIQTNFRDGFFAFGVHAAIQWEQVMRMKQLHVM